MSTTARTLPQWKRFRFPHSLIKYAVLLAALVFVWWALEVLRIAATNRGRLNMRSQWSRASAGEVARGGLLS